MGFLHCTHPNVFVTKVNLCRQKCDSAILCVSVPRFYVSEYGLVHSDTSFMLVHNGIVKHFRRITLN